MKTTVDLPDELVQRIKLRAVQERKPLKRFMADLLLRGLESPPLRVPDESEPLPREIMVNESGFPVVRCGPDAPAARWSADERIALERRNLEEEDLKRAGVAR